MTQRVVGAIQNFARGRGLFVLAVCAAVVFFAAHIVGSLMVSRLGFDSAYNLTVPRNLAAGHGYTSDGVLGTETLTPYDVRVSTGPTVLWPLSLAFLLGENAVFIARSMMLVPYCALIAGLALAGHRLSGRWGALTGAVAPLTINVFLDTTWAEYQGPTDILGEVPAAALLVWALLASRRHPFVASMLIGLAVLTKTIVLLSAPFFLALLVSWLLRDLSGPMRMVRVALRALAYCATAAVPILAWEAKKLTAFGLNGYLENLLSFMEFFVVGGSGLRDDSVHDPSPGIRGLLHFWGLPPLLVVISALVLVFLSGMWFQIRYPALRNSRNSEQFERYAWVLFATLNLSLWAYWWTFVSEQTYSRSLLPALFVSVPILLAAIVALLRSGINGEVAIFRRFCVVLTAAAVVVLPVQTAGNVMRALTANYALSHQLGIVDAIQRLGVTEVNYVGTLRNVVDISVLANLKVVKTAGGATAALPMLMSSLDAPAGTLSTVDEHCGEVLAASGRFTLCAPPS